MIRIWVLFCGIAIFIGTAPWAAAAGGYDSAAEQQILQLLNQARQQHGLPPLQEDARLQAAARAHAQLMASQGKLSHQLPGEPILRQRLALRGVRMHTDGENVAFNQSAEAVQEGFLHSPPHRANVLSPRYNAVGVGAVERNGTVWVTEDFAALKAR
jgi:uncharacterized protein YkwD